MRRRSVRRERPKGGQIDPKPLPFRFTPRVRHAGRSRICLNILILVTESPSRGMEYRVRLGNWGIRFSRVLWKCLAIYREIPEIVPRPMIVPGFVTKPGAIVQGRTEGGKSKPRTLARAGIRPGRSRRRFRWFSVRKTSLIVREEKTEWKIGKSLARRPRKARCRGANS